MMIYRSDLADKIKSILTIQEVCEGYGINFNNNKALCPFHSDKHPSASIKNNRFHCYVCNLHLNTIDFAMQYFNCDFKQAIARLNADFHLNLSSEPIDRAEQEKQNKARAERLSVVEAYRGEYRDKCKEFYLLRQLIRFKPADMGQAKTKALAVSRLYYLDYWFSENYWR